MKTVTIQIGNSDNKLTQIEWSEYVGTVNNVVRNTCKEIHFHGAPPNYARQQNACWVISCDERTESLQSMLTSIRQQFRQDAVAWTEGETVFV